MSASRQYSDRALLLLATFASLCFGKLADQRRNEIDLNACEVRVNASTSEMDDGRRIHSRSGEVNGQGPGGRALRHRRTVRHQAVRVVDPLGATVDLRGF